MADNLLVNRDGVTYQVDLENRNMIEPTDLLLVNRDGVTYTITGDEIGLPDIEVSKGVITPFDDVEEGDTLTGTATYVNAIQPVTLYHKWYVDGVQDTSATSNTFTAKEGQVTYRLCVADPNNTTPVEGELSDPVTVAPRTTPNATMYGLRVDDPRQTNTGTFPLANTSSFTLSVWVKTGLGLTIGMWPGGTGDELIALTPDNSLVISWGNGSNTWPDIASDNVWTLFSHYRRRRSCYGVC